MKHLLITLTALGLALSAANAQMGPGGPTGSDTDTPQAMGPGHNIPEEVRAFQADVAEKRDALRESRNALIESLGDATQEEIAAALELWKEENAEALDEVHALGEELRELIRANRPDHPWLDVPEEITAKREELKSQRQALDESRDAAIAALGEDPTDEEVRAAIAQWREENATQIQEMQALAEELRLWFRENRPGRSAPEFSAGMAQRKAAFKENLMAMRQEHNQLRAQMQDSSLTQEERAAIIQEFREQQRELMRERQALKRQERLSQGGAGGDRRPGG